MQVDDCFFIGYTTKTATRNGEITLKLDVDTPHHYYNLESLFIQLSPADKQLVPFFIEKITPQQKEFIRIKFESVDSISQASEICGKSAWLPLSMLPKLGGNKFYFHEVTDFTIIDKKFGKVGSIKNILQYPAQAIFEISSDGKEVLIPITDAIIQKVDRGKKEIHIIAPEGLIELYLNG